MKWPYPCLKCRLYEVCEVAELCGGYCLVIHDNHEEKFRRIVEKYGLNRLEATALIFKFRGMGACMDYLPDYESAKGMKIRLDVVRKAFKELDEIWDVRDSKPQARRAV